ncbi:MAG: glycosyltransferase family 2 protein [Clostridia bacterium]|nr:glycosyltransferase family 2 protein [Clostridia bacterium]
MKTLTVFTPAYNRAYLLGRCYESLCRQTSKDFVWLVVDDGSTDNTRELVEGWQKEDNGFPIQYVYKENGGMHTAHNTAYEHIKTELNVCIDSDDYMPDNAVEIILNCWKEHGSEKYAGIIALDVDNENLEVIGDNLPLDDFSITLSEFHERGGKGDKKLIYRTDVITSVPPYPVFEGEKFVSLGYKYTLVDQQYELIILNEPVCVVEYVADGSTKNMYRQYVTNPQGWSFIRKFEMQYQKNKKRLFILNVHYISSSIMLKDKGFLKNSPKKFYTVAAIPFGIVLYCLTKYKTRKIKQ